MERITRRRRQLDDPTTEMIGTDPRDVLDYLHKHDHRGMPAWAAHADISDSLVLLNWLWWEDRRRRLTVLRAGRRHGMGLMQLGTPLGMRSRQGAQDLQDRLEALLRYDRPDEKLTRTGRRLSDPDDTDARAAWIAANTHLIHDTARQLLTEAEAWNVPERDWLDELAADLADDAVTPATIAVLGLATAEIRASPGLHALKTWHRLNRILGSADGLRAEYARL